ncbi:hypothetical protein [Desulfonatronum thioautotrophicum]|uniref:hypothetical protein n=1 Tax=Desulfonatronum thioautotrophicum TaxID=617001 RepID=UPI0005EB6F74|nr:hypothetical protein [Desulfonatronum thioautotrophicum]
MHCITPSPAETALLLDADGDGYNAVKRLNLAQPDCAKKFQIAQNGWMMSDRRRVHPVKRMGKFHEDVQLVLNVNTRAWS